MNRRQFISGIASSTICGAGIWNLLSGALSLSSVKVEDSPGKITLSAGKYTMSIHKRGFRYFFLSEGKPIMGPHPESGLVLGTEPVLDAEYKGSQGEWCSFQVKTAQNISATVKIAFREQSAHLQVALNDVPPMAIVARTGGAAPGYGLADMAVQGGRYTTDITGYRNDHFLSGEGFSRLVSNFTFYPKQGFAVVLIDPQTKIIYSTKQEIAQGMRQTRSFDQLHYFFGDPHRIYHDYLMVRNQNGYPVMQPKYEFFGVGWEAFGALGWNTNQQTVTENVDRYLSLGYPLQWIIVGSGHWPHSNPSYEATTSFGMFDPKLYPEPAALIEHFHRRGLKFMLGLRIAFITDGPFSAEGVAKGYFIQEDGGARVFKIGFPKSPCYLLDAQNAQAVSWYSALVKKWTDYGVDGFKEDVYGFGGYSLRDDKLDPVNAALMREGLYVMGRNMYTGSPADLHRINDFNYNEDQDRGPVNSLALAYSGFPLVYPDIVGGTFAEKRFGLTVTPRMKTYMMRNAQWASVHPSMSMGQPPWEFDDPQVESVMLAAAQLHGRLHPYIYSQAVRFYRDGYPWTMAPLPVAYPDDEATYNRENAQVRGFEWMIGDALLATPLYGNNFAIADKLDIYLPRGAWIDYDSGTKFDGPRILKDYPMPVGKTPLFVGGTGIVIEREEPNLLGRLYPVTRNAETVFWGRDGKTESHLTLRNVDWSSPRVVDTSAKVPVKGEWIRHAYQFLFEPGHNYENPLVS